MIDARNGIKRDVTATTGRGEIVLLASARHEAFRRAYGTGDVSGQMNRWIGQAADGRLFAGRSLKSMRDVSKDKPAAASVTRGLRAK